MFAIEERNNAADGLNFAVRDDSGQVVAAFTERDDAELWMEIELGDELGLRVEMVHASDADDGADAPEMRYV